MTRRPDPGPTAQAVTAGLDRAAGALPDAASGRIDRLVLRLRPGARPEDVARALLGALPPAAPEDAE